VVVVSLVAIVAPAAAAAPSSLSDTARAIRWHGGPLDGATVRPEACAALDCDVRSIRVALPSGTWSRSGGVQIGIRWAHITDDLDLFVYGPDEALAASSAGLDSTSESVVVPEAANGTYRVVVVPSGASAARYEGIAEVEFVRRAAPRRELRPDLVPLPTRSVNFTTSAYYFALPVPSLPTGCYPEETAEKGALRCLRFDQTIANTGEGSLEVHFRVDGVATTQALTQRIFRSDGSVRDRFADTYEFHPTHAHFHYKSFAQSHLWRSDAQGRRLGDKPIRSGWKNGFCLVDSDNVAFGSKGDAARTYIPPACLAPTRIDPASGEIAMISGISPGWADVYGSHLPDQYIEISGVPDGDYLIQTVADPAGTLVESNDRNNTSWTHIRLRGDSVEVIA
jgi:hypothetical protein